MDKNRAGKGMKLNNKLHKRNEAFGDVDPSEVTNCLQCNTRIWKLWHIGSSIIEPMEYCAPCLFK